ncbi:MBL fold metallo-hydrolase [Chromobacterium phragmitis]|uniref:MBL fold metallo-hydrolase n=2 Tax=Chromobacterium phragmitis TaxID=2202141 RepID=A0A344UIX5_9NEIS|nr:MBL fold metallo-hydrolase [Chromobacterium phragmitis]AXE29832.1 MBL fold metallo-hydrolase [Chromobacterium phragmitis]AXE35223.1 MBL fold metallo-hydrolase [Chromobacterium phragmitis]
MRFMSTPYHAAVRAIRMLPLAAALAASATSIQAAQPVQPPAQVRTQAPGFYRMMLGAFEVTALSDGTVAVPLDQLLRNPPEDTASRLAQAHLGTRAETSINAFLIHTGSHLALVDAGAGDLFGKDGGRLLDSIRAAGYRPEDIDTVLLTHIHADHSGGLTRQGKRMFPAADIRVDQRDVDFWLNPANAGKVAKEERHAFADAEAALRPYIEAGRLKPFDGETELLPGIRAVAGAGHTPGHSLYLVESEGKKLVLWGDLIHAQDVQFAKPGVTIRFDVDAAAAARQRLARMDEAARQGWLVAAAHIGFPGIGHVRRSGDGYLWQPVRYSLEGLRR